MSLKFKEFCTIEFKAALKKVCEFDHNIADKLKLMLLKDKITKEEENGKEIMKEINSKYTEDFNKSESEEEKKKINEEYVKKQNELNETVSTIVPSLDFDLAAKTSADANDLHTLLPILKNIPETETKEV